MAEAVSDSFSGRLETEVTSMFISSSTLNRLSTSGGGKASCASRRASQVNTTAPTIIAGKADCQSGRKRLPLSWVLKYAAFIIEEFRFLVLVRRAWLLVAFRRYVTLCRGQHDLVAHRRICAAGRSTCAIVSCCMAGQLCAHWPWVMSSALDHPLS